MASLGVLKLKIIEAKLTRDVKSVRKMDPYVKINMREQEWKGNTDERGGKHPKWADSVCELDIKYLGDDIFINMYDDDPGKDEKICDGEVKASAFAAYPEFDEWHRMEWKGKEVGKLHIISTWAPCEAPQPTKEEHEDEMGKATAMISEINNRKKELEAEYAQVQESLKATEEQVAEIQAEFTECDCEGNYDTAVDRANKRFDRDLERAERNKQEGLKMKEDFEAQQEAKIAKSEAYQAKKLEEYDAADARADEKLAAFMERLDVMKDNEEEERAKELERLEKQIDDQKAEDQAKYDEVADEIKAVAEELLEVNQKMQDYLTKLTEL